MRFTITLHNLVYGEWESFKKWDREFGIQTWLQYSDFVKLAYPEVLSTKFDWQTTCRTFEFESEQHYHWFLLKQ